MIPVVVCMVRKKFMREGRVPPVVVCVKHEGIVEVDEERGLSLAKQERDVHHLELLSHLLSVQCFSPWCYFAQTSGVSQAP
jgi:uncharacterized membrane protein